MKIFLKSIIHLSSFRSANYFKRTMRGVMLIDCSQFGFPETKVQVFDPNEDIGDPFLRLE